MKTLIALLLFTTITLAQQPKGMALVDMPQHDVELIQTDALVINAFGDRLTIQAEETDIVYEIRDKRADNFHSYIRYIFWIAVDRCDRCPRKTAKLVAWERSPGQTELDVLKIRDSLSVIYGFIKKR